ncbi:SCO4225 family membrane protein [Cryptosporangium arvum]|uniref:Integral membrane protein n=1 Tax=Cryptosporangium arvum DSM 44712 TaxID=927661 RepID=A0A011AFU8_9ACTN|nr:hypothetical protein [Cryptosporangium arvum]EXG80901.1 hypothetical protein CryarDRAFT_1996 [Cryptosporangium arvum DSM 44712]
MRILQLAFGNWFSRAYLIGVAVVAAVVTFSLATWDQPDANLAGVWLVFVTMPFSLPLLAITPDSALGPVVFYAVCAVAAVANAAFIGGMVALYRRSRRRPAH